MWWKYFEQNMKNYQIAYSKWKELNQIVLGKRALYFSVGVFLFGKRHLDSPEGQVEVKSPIIQSYFWHLWFKLRNFFPLKNSTFNQASNHHQMLYLSEMILFSWWYWLLYYQLTQHRFPSDCLAHYVPFYSALLVVFYSVMTFYWNFSAALWFCFNCINFAELIPGVHITPPMTTIFSQRLQYKYGNIYSCYWPQFTLHLKHKKNTKKRLKAFSTHFTLSKTIQFICFSLFCQNNSFV